jgi:hypothetical protein
VRKNGGKLHLWAIIPTGNQARGEKDAFWIPVGMQASETEPVVFLAEWGVELSVCQYH